MLKTKIIFKQFKEIKEGARVYNLEIQNEMQRPEAVAKVLDILSKQISDEEKANRIINNLVGKGE